MKRSFFVTDYCWKMVQGTSNGRDRKHNEVVTDHFKSHSYFGGIGVISKMVGMTFLKHTAVDLQVC